jgi:hypothetical protein
VGFGKDEEVRLGLSKKEGRRPRTAGPPACQRSVHGRFRHRDPGDHSLGETVHTRPRAVADAVLIRGFIDHGAAAFGLWTLSWLCSVKARPDNRSRPQRGAPVTVSFTLRTSCSVAGRGGPLGWVIVIRTATRPSPIRFAGTGNA